MLTENELDRLDALLLSLPLEVEGMMLSEFDGFCAGLIVSPEMILPGEWLPCVWGDGAEHLETPEDVQELTDLIMRHYNSVAQSLTPPALAYGPIFDVDTHNDDTIWELWCCGFERAMRLRPDAWEHMASSADEDVAASINLMLTLYNIADGTCDLPKASARALTEEAPDIIPNLVLTLNDWTKSGASAAPFPSWAAANRASPPSQGKKVGRNAPCPCGSGRKYKQCCGRN